MNKLNLRKALATAGAGLVLTSGLWLTSSSAFAAPSASSRAQSANAGLGTFVPYWQNVEASPGGCSGPVTTGYSISGPSGCGTDSNGNGIVDFVYLFGGSSFSYTFTVPPGSVAHVSYGIPAAQGLGNGTSSFQGGFYNNSPANVSVDGTPKGTITKDIGIFGSECQTTAPCIVWKSPTLGAGKHTLTISAVRDDINLYGLWVALN